MVAQLRSAAAYPSLSLAACRIADQVKVIIRRSKSSAAQMAVHDESSQYDSFYLHSYDDVPDVKHDLEALAEENADRLTRQKRNGGGLLSPCGTIRPEKFFSEDPAAAYRDAGVRVPPTHYNDKKANPPPHSDLCHLEDPYHKYDYHPHLTMSSSDLLSELDSGTANDVTVSHCNPPQYKITQDDTSGTTVEVDVTKYTQRDVSAEIENGQDGHLLHVHAHSSCWTGHDTATEELEAFDMRLPIGPNIVEDGVTAKLKGGTLTIHIPKRVKEVVKVKNIPIAA